MNAQGFCASTEVELSPGHSGHGSSEAPGARCQSAILVAIVLIEPVISMPRASSSWKRFIRATGER